jgi:hypothetical protein
MVTPERMIKLNQHISLSIGNEHKIRSPYRAQRFQNFHSNSKCFFIQETHPSNKKLDESSDLERESEPSTINP